MTVWGVLAAAGAGAWSVIQYEQGAKPRIRIDGGLVVREFRAGEGCSNIDYSL